MVVPFSLEDKTNKCLGIKMISVFKFSEGLTVEENAPEGQNNQPITLCAGRGVSKRREQSHRAAEKDMFGVN